MTTDWPRLPLITCRLSRRPDPCLGRSGIRLRPAHVNHAYPPVDRGRLTFLTLVLPVILYFCFQESSLTQATWGKRKLGLRVVTAIGARLSLVWVLVGA
jgi:uncharacterized RDD family membrane protein YckC